MKPREATEHRVGGIDTGEQALPPRRNPSNRQALFRACRRSELRGGGKRATGGPSQACGEAKLMGGQGGWKRGDVGIPVGFARMYN